MIYISFIKPKIDIIARKDMSLLNQNVLSNKKNVYYIR